MKHPAALSFTGGKDCVLALAEVLRGEDPAYQGVEIKVLVTFGPATAFQEDEDDDDDMQEPELASAVVTGNGQCGTAASGPPPSSSSSQPQPPSTRRKKKKGFLAHPLSVIRAQAEALGLPHLCIPIDGAGEGGYMGAYQAALRVLREGPHGVTHLVTGDILDVCDGFMEKAAAGAGCTLVRPLWQQPRAALLAKMAPFTFLLSCCSVDKMGADQAREYVGLTGPAAYARLCKLVARNEREEKEGGERLEIDACGEQGEFHSMVMDAPFFRHGRLAFHHDSDSKRPPILETEDGRFLYCDLSRLVLVPK